MKFVDLFAGLGGFHLAMRRLGHQCVFACEIDEDLRKLYEKNFGMKPSGDIASINVRDVPDHDILCAGFPCQPFSKAGEQRGFRCPKWGELFRTHTLRIIRYHRPAYLLLENVPNLAFHDDGATWRTLERKLTNLGYEVAHRRLSPHQFGIPQIRDRIFIVASLNGLKQFSWPESNGREPSLKSILDYKPAKAQKLSAQALECLGVWQEFIKLFSNDNVLPSFPLWSMEFGASYPFETITPHGIGKKRLHSFRGSHGVRLSKVPDGELFKHLPSHARAKRKKFPDWKVVFIRQNREFYRKHKSLIDPWLPKILKFPSSFQKLEWNCKGEHRDIWKYVLQFRPSGVRVKRPTTAPALVAFTTSQVPIIAWERRYMTIRECARLQSLGTLKYLPEAQTRAFKALGNAVNVDLIKMIGSRLISKSRRRLPKGRKHGS